MSMTVGGSTAMNKLASGLAFPPGPGCNTLGCAERFCVSMSRICCAWFPDEFRIGVVSGVCSREDMNKIMRETCILYTKKTNSNTDLQSMQSVRGIMIASVCLEPCLAVCDDHIRQFCRPITKVTEPPSGHMHTWIPEGSDIVFIVKSSVYTLLYIPSNDMMYYAHPMFALGPQCADHTIFISQFVIDHGNTPRLLVFDMLTDGAESLCGMPASERYGILQKRLSCLQAPQCILQWVGELHAMDHVFLGGLPHGVKSLLTLTDDPRRVCIHGRQKPCASRDGDSVGAPARKIQRLE